MRATNLVDTHTILTNKYGSKNQEKVPKMNL